jgi:FixJ family two-component response regulator
LIVNSNFVGCTTDAVDAGCIAYLRKPFAAHVLLDAIGKALA